MRVHVSVQFTVLVNTVDTCSTVIVPKQLSAVITKPILGAGITPLQPTAIGAGQVIVGGVTSTFLVINCVQVAELPHASVAR